MIAPADFPPHPEKGRVMLDGYRNLLIWEHSRLVLTDSERSDAEYRKSIASYSAPWNPKVGQHWLDLKTGKLLVNHGLNRWVFAETGMESNIPVEAPLNHWSVNAAYNPPPYPTGAELEKQTKAKTKPIPQEPEPPKKSRVFTFD